MQWYKLLHSLVSLINSYVDNNHCHLVQYLQSDYQIPNTSEVANIADILTSFSQRFLITFY